MSVCEHTDRKTNRGGKHLHIQRQSDLYPRNIASSDRPGDRRLEGESKPQQSRVIASLWCPGHMELAVWQRDYYYRQMVRWWLFSGGSAGWVWPSGSSPGAATSSLGSDPPLEGTAGLAHSLGGEVVTRIMLETQDAVFFVFYSRGTVPDLDHIGVYLNEENERRKERTNEWKKERRKKQHLDETEETWK